MIATAHPIAEVLGELLAQYQARGLFADDSKRVKGTVPVPESGRALVPAWPKQAALTATLSACI